LAFFKSTKLILSHVLPFLQANHTKDYKPKPTSNYMHARTQFTGHKEQIHTCFVVAGVWG